MWSGSGMAFAMMLADEAAVLNQAKGCIIAFTLETSTS
jgi:hypothetical protein